MKINKFQKMVFAYGDKDAIYEWEEIFLLKTLGHVKKTMMNFFCINVAY
jgi:hypothetical protein